MMSECSSTLNGLLRTTPGTDWFHSPERPDRDTQAAETPARSQLKSLPSMPLRRVSVSIVCLLVAGATVVCVSGTTPLQSFRGCAVREFSFVAQKPGCKGLHVTTEACWGRCHTWERPILEPPFIHRHHRVCTYSHIRHMTVRLPGCLPDISPLYHYPVALQCHCSFCSMEDTECQTF